MIGRCRMVVVPGDEVRRRDRSGQLLARDAEPVVGRSSDGVDDGVVAGEQVFTGHVRTELHATEEAEAGMARGLLTGVTDLILGWSGATPARTRPNGVGSVVEVDGEAGLQELVGGIEAPRGPAPTTAARMSVSKSSMVLSFLSVVSRRCCGRRTPTAAGR